MPVYPTLAVATALVTVAVELLWMRTGVFRQLAYWTTMAISFGFMIVVDGWLTKLSAPIVIYDDGNTSGLRPIWDILLEEYAYAFAMLTMVLVLWERRRHLKRERSS